MPNTYTDVIGEGFCCVELEQLMAYPQWDLDDVGVRYCGNPIVACPFCGSRLVPIPDPPIGSCLPVVY